MKYLILGAIVSTISSSVVANEYISLPPFTNGKMVVDKCEGIPVKPVDGAVIQCEGIESYKILSPSLVHLRERLEADPIQKELFELYEKNFSQRLGVSHQATISVNGRVYRLITNQSYGFYVNEER
ncbi:hypothetical protein HR45_19195 [Shewanella mangrovi]|uniref:Periplasmic protein n=1 Tax=Shewanella mangrovi TaxID=1515746 RepID=A0A094JD24_9GAMM|nr:hypothetical protein [Shewanella mangrovi]KFZ35939.1 hypothetical protein HR45_19195 [Shewanella mangrovi]